MAALEPDGQKAPVPHCPQCVFPLSAWKLPFGHAVQTAWPAEAAMEPGEQAEGAIEPVLHAEPAGHAKQSEAAIRLS